MSRRLEEPSGERLDRATLMALLDASRAINDEIEPDEACQLVAERAAAVLDSESASVMLLDPATNELVFHSVVDTESGRLVPGSRFPADKGIAGQVLRTGRAVCLDDVRENQNFYSGIDELTRSSTRSLMAAPLAHGGSAFGVIEVINRRGPDGFGPDQLELLSLFASLISGAARKIQAVDRLNRDNRGLRESIPPADFIGRSASFEHAVALCRKVAATPTTVLLRGETGTGKEMAARAIWAWSRRPERPFVAINCAALPESLVESELFGHEAGAFTGAVTSRPGRFQLADGGTLLLDEIGELDLNVQAKLLRVLESGECTPVGGTTPVTFDVRLIAATNRDLQADAEAGRFRTDLFYRLDAFPIVLPPLRERLDDIPLLAEHLIARVAPSLGCEVPTVSDEALTCLRRYRWPGNIRELRNIMERAVLLAENSIGPEHLPPEIASASRAGGIDATPGASDAASTMTTILADQEERLVLEALERNDWNQSAAARDLGISRDIMRYRMKRYGLKRPPL